MGNGWRHLVPSLAGLLALGCTALPGDLVADDAAFEGGLPIAVHRVESFGLWQDADREGRQRIVVMRHCLPTRCADRAYLQWLVDRVDAGGRYERSEELSTAELSEIGPHIAIERITPAPTVSHPARFEIEHADTFSGEVMAHCVTPGAPGSYEVRIGAC